jgi:hypothetical protein
MLERMNRIDEAYQSFTKAIELATAQAGTTTPDKARLYLNRCNFLKRQNRLAEAAKDFCLAKNIPVRDSQAKKEEVDLTLYYNASLTESWHTAGIGHDLALLPRGIQTLAGVPFDIRGLIQIGSVSRAGEKYPKELSGIAVGLACQRLHLLHAAVSAYGTKEGTQIGSYIVRYANGQTREIPIVVGRDIADWFSQPNEANQKFVVAWTGTNESSRAQGRTIRLFKSTWENPIPEVTVNSIDFISSHEGAAPFLVAITAE